MKRLASSNVSSSNNRRVTTIAAGGQVFEGKDYIYHKFSASGNFIVSYPGLEVEFVVIAGGGSGGDNVYSGGGGAGEVIIGTYTFSRGSYNVAVGAGGSTSSQGNASWLYVAPENAVIATGGGKGGIATSPYVQSAGSTGGSGGGGPSGFSTNGTRQPGGTSTLNQNAPIFNSYMNPGGLGLSANTSTQNRGAYPAGGGGGAGAPGVAGTRASAGPGGVGLDLSDWCYETGSGQISVGRGYIAAGGGGGHLYQNDVAIATGPGGVGGGGTGRRLVESTGEGTPATDAVVNTGSGGGGGSTVSTGRGSSGLVMIRYKKNVDSYSIFVNSTSSSDKFLYSTDGFRTINPIATPGINQSSIPTNYESQAVGDNGKFLIKIGVKLYYSTDLKSFVDVSSFAPEPISEILYYKLRFGNGRFFIVNGNGRKIFYSDNATSWTQVDVAGTADDGETNAGYAYGNGVHILSGASMYSSNKYKYSTDNGITWQVGTFPSSAFYDTIVFGNFNGNNVFYTIPKNSIGAANTCHISSDGINWTTQQISPDNFARYFSVQYKNGIWVWLTQQSDYFYATSSNSSSPIRMTLPPGFTADYTTSFVENSVSKDTFSVFVSTPNGNSMYHSKNGISWYSGPAPFESSAFSAIVSL